MSSVLLSTKLRSPGLRPGIVARPRLMETAKSGTETTTVIVAPPGFGKSMLLAQWEEQDDRPFAWVSLDRRDNDPLLLWNYLVAAMRRIEPEFAASLDPELTSAGGTVLDDLIPRILNEIESFGREIVAVLDDYHVITNAACHESIALLIERGPPNLQVVISSRHDPPLPLGRLRASGGLFELRAAELGFTEAETEELFCGVFGLQLDPDSIAALHRRTEGWPAGLYLAYLSVRDANDPAAALAEFDGSSRHLVEYLTEVVLESETEEHRSFLLETSILERMCAPLCDMVTGREDASLMLVEIEHANLFLVPLDERREWFRYHHLFAELLRDLRRRHTDLEIEGDLHRRAREWYAAAGYYDEAIGHAITGVDFDAAATLIGTHWLEYLNTGRTATITGWLESFPPGFVRGDAQLSIIEAWLRGNAGFVKEAMQALTDAEESGYEGELPDGSGTLLESVTLVRASFPVWSGVGALLEAARSTYETEARRRSVWQAQAAFDFGWAHVLKGDTDEAVAPLEEALAHAARHKQWVVAADARCILSEAALAAGELDQAERWIGEALDVARTHGFVNLAHVGFYYAMLAELQSRRGQFELADQTFASGLDQLDGKAPLLCARALLGRALVRRALGARSHARKLLDEARAQIEHIPDPGVLSQHIDEASRKMSVAVRKDPDSDLTVREIEVLRLLAAGLTKPEVAAKLFVSYSTVHSHTKSIYRKLDGASRHEVLDRAQELGLLGG